MNCHPTRRVTLEHCANTLQNRFKTWWWNLFTNLLFIFVKLILVHVHASRLWYRVLNTTCRKMDRRSCRRDSFRTDEGSVFYTWARIRTMNRSGSGADTNMSSSFVQSVILSCFRRTFQQKFQDPNGIGQYWKDVNYQTFKLWNNE
jgi:hypothetical protein